MKEEKKKIEPIDYSSLLDGLDNKWVVISRDHKKLLAVADNLENLGETVGKGIVLLVQNYSYAPSLSRP